MTAAPPRILTVPEVAAILRISRSAAYALTRTGELPSFRIGASIRVRESDLHEWISEQVEAGFGSNATSASAIAPKKRGKKPLDV